MTSPAAPVAETARAKINLTLHVVARRDDGYHELDSLVTFASIGDGLRFAAADCMRLDVDGPFATELSSDSGNLALVAARLMERTWPDQISPAAIGLTKTLPVAAGIGGGSSDAAAVIRGLMRMGCISASKNQLTQLAAELGADVPVCLQPGTWRMGGIGEVLRPQSSLPSWDAVLVNPLIQVSTPAVFKVLDLKRGQAAFEAMPEPPQGAPREEWIAWLSSCRNDLQAPAIELVPDIGLALDLIATQSGCLLSRMSGSGATCFGLFDSTAAAEAAKTAIVTAQPNWWVARTVIG